MVDRLLKKYLPCGQVIDSITIDVEGLDLAVLRSNDWHLFRLKGELAEALDVSLDESIHTDLTKFMLSQCFSLLCKNLYYPNIL